MSLLLLYWPTPQDITGLGLVSGEAFGAGSLEFDGRSIYGAGITSGEFFGVSFLDADVVHATSSPAATSLDGTISGPTTGGTPIYLQGTPLNFSAAETAFTDTAVWTPVVSANASVRDKNLILGRGTSSAIVRYSASYDYLDASFSVPRVPSTTSVWTGFYLDADNYIRAYLNGRLVVRIGGTDVIDLPSTGVKSSADLRIMRARESVYIFFGGVLRYAVRWLATSAYFEIGAASTSSSNTANVVPIANFTRAPVVTFGTSPALEFKRQSTRSFIVYAPKATFPGKVPVVVHTGLLTISLDTNLLFTYNYPVTFRDISQGTTAVSDLLVKV